MGERARILTTIHTTYFRSRRFMDKFEDEDIIEAIRMIEENGGSKSRVERLKGELELRNGGDEEIQHCYIRKGYNGETWIQFKHDWMAAVLAVKAGMGVE